MYIKTTMNTHAKQRVIERLGQDALADLQTNFNFAHAKYRYVDCSGKQHVYNCEYGAELVGIVVHGWFRVQTVIKMSYSAYCKRREAYSLQRF